MVVKRLKNRSYAKADYQALGELYANISLPANKILSHVPRSGLLTEQDFVNRGIRYIDNLSSGPASAPRRIALYGVQETRGYCQSKGIPNVASMTQAQVEDYILNYLAPVGFVTHSLSEGYDDLVPYTMFTNMPQYDWANNALAVKLNQLNPPAVMIADYDNKYQAVQDVFYPANGAAHNPDTEVNRNALLSQANARAGLPFYGKGVSNFARPNLTMYPGYTPSKSMGRRNSYMCAYGMMRLSIASGPSLEPILFSWPSLEGFDGYTGSFAWQHNLPNGKLYQNHQAYWSRNTYYKVCFLAFALGAGNIAWSGVQHYGNDPTSVKFEPVVKPGEVNVADHWVPNVAGTPAPTKTTTYPFMRRAENIASVPLEAAEDFSEMANATGQNYRFLRFRTDKGSGFGAWETPNEANNKAYILTAAQKYAGFALAAGTGNDWNLYYENPGNTLAGELAQIELPNGALVNVDHYGQEPVRIYGTFLPGSSYTVLRVA